jgi:hypothetical protein
MLYTSPLSRETEENHKDLSIGGVSIGILIRDIPNAEALPLERDSFVDGVEIHVSVSKSLLMKNSNQSILELRPLNFKLCPISISYNLSGHRHNRSSRSLSSFVLLPITKSDTPFGVYLPLPRLLFLKNFCG